MATPERRPERKLHRLEADAYASSAYEFFFTVCARHQGRPFDDASLAEEVIKSLLWTKDKYRWTLYCYSLMPDHLHFVCRVPENNRKLTNAGARGIIVEGVLDHLSRFKSYTTTESWKYGFRGKLWQKNSYDRVLDLHRPFEEIAFYTLENPVRKGLVKDWREWPYFKIVDGWL